MFSTLPHVVAVRRLPPSRPGDIWRFAIAVCEPSGCVHWYRTKASQTLSHARLRRTIFLAGGPLLEKMPPRRWEALLSVLLLESEVAA